MSSLLALAFSVFMQVKTGGAAAWWPAEMERLISTLPAADYERIDLARMKQAMAYANGVVAALLVINLIATVILARWWQSMLYNPGGFGVEFQALQLPRWLLPIAGLFVGLRNHVSHDPNRTPSDRSVKPPIPVSRSWTHLFDNHGRTIERQAGDRVLVDPKTAAVGHCRSSKMGRQACEPRIHGRREAVSRCLE